MTIEITRPETQTLIEQHLRSGRFHDIDELLARALRALSDRNDLPPAEGKNLVELFAPVRGLFADGELDFSRKDKADAPGDRLILPMA